MIKSTNASSLFHTVAVVRCDGPQPSSVMEKSERVLLPVVRADEATAACPAERLVAKKRRGYTISRALCAGWTHEAM